MINLLIAAVVIYFLGVYLAYFAFGVLGELYGTADLVAWFWTLALIFIFTAKMVPVAQRWATRLKPITGPFSRLLRKSIFFLSLPFRPFFLGHLVRERLHLSPNQ